MIAGLAPGSRVPVEFVGLARALRSRITSAYVDFDSGMARLLEERGEIGCDEAVALVNAAMAPGEVG